MFWLEIKVPGESVRTHQIHVFLHISPLPCCLEDEGEKQEELGGTSWNQHIFTDVVLAAGVLCVAYFMPPLCAGVRAESHGAFSRFSHGSPGVRPHPGLPGGCLGERSRRGRGWWGHRCPPLAFLSIPGEL